jgi:chromosome segregation ATPase
MAIDRAADGYYRGCMSQFGERAVALQDLQDSLRAELHLVLAEAGSHLLQKPARIAGVDLSEIRQREKDVTAQVEEATKTRDRISEIEDRLVGAKEEAAALQADIRRLSEDIDPIYEEVGSIAFDVYRGNPLVDQEYADLFTPLVEVNSELSGIDAAMAEQQALLEAKPFLEKMVIRGRIALLRNRRTTREGSFKRLIRTAGHDIMATSFVDEIGDPKLSAAAEPYRDRLIATRERETDLAALSEERKALLQEMESLGAGKRSQKKREELDEDLLILTQTSTAIRAELARAVRNAADAELPSRSRQLFATAQTLEKRLEAVVAVSERIQAAVEAERLEDESERLTGEIYTRETRQADLKKEIAALKRDVKTIDSKLESKRQTRGSVDELLAPELLNDL